MNADETATRPEEATEVVPAIPPFPARYVRFGEFQLDAQRDELWRNGERIRLQGKVYQTLLILLSRAGNVVTRDEVRRYLWPENPQVNFDANVNTSINKLRQALGDSPEKPQYIETIPRKGYCFLPTVEFADALLRVSVKPAIASAEPRSENATPSRSLAAKLPHSLPLGLRITILVLAGMVLGAILVLLWFSYRRNYRAQQPDQVSVVAVADAVNRGCRPRLARGSAGACQSADFAEAPARFLCSSSALRPDSSLTRNPIFG